MRGPLFKAHIALLAVNTIYGANYVLAKDVMPDHLTPAPFVMTRVLGALVLFWLLNRMVGLNKLQWKDVPRLALCGLFGVAVNQLFFFHGLNLTSPVDSSIIMITTPIIVVGLSWIILREKLSKSRGLGILLGLGGAVGVILIDAGSGGRNSSLEGNTFIMINACSYALYLVLVKPLMSRYSPLTVISYAFLFGSAFVVPYSLPEFAEQSWEFPTDVWLKVLFVVICVTFLAYLLNIYALKIVSPAVSSSYIYLQPILGTSFALLHDSVTGDSMAGEIQIWHGLFAVMIAGGVYMVSRRASS